MTPLDDTLQIALDFLTANPECFTFPIEPGKKFPPKVNDNLAGNASNDHEQIAAWHKKWPGCCWGIAAAKSGWIIIDVDTNKIKGKVGADTFFDLDLEHGFPPTRTTTTPSGGKHHIYKGKHIFAIDALGKDIDVPNYVLIPGCTLDSGGSYVADNADPVADCPQWIYDVIRQRKADKARGSKGGGADPIPLATFEQMLVKTPYKGGPKNLDDRHGHDGWLNFMMAVHEAAHGDDGEYLDAFISWCLNDPDGDEKWNAEDITNRWQSLAADKSGGVTRGSWEKLLLYFGHDELVSEAGQGAPASADFGDDDAVALAASITVAEPERVAAEVKERAARIAERQAEGIKPLPKSNRASIHYRAQDMAQAVHDVMTVIRLDKRHDHVFRRGPAIVRLNQMVKPEELEGKKPTDVTRKWGALTIREVVPDYLSLRLAQAARVFVPSGAMGRPKKQKGESPDE